MTTATATKTASVIKITKGSEKNWTDTLSMNRRHELQLPIDLAKVDENARRVLNTYRRHQTQIESNWSHKHATWYHDDFMFRNHLLKQLKPITQRFKRIDSSTLTESDEYDNKNQPGILNSEEQELLVSSPKAAHQHQHKRNVKKRPIIILQPLKNTKQRPAIRHFQTKLSRNNDNNEPKGPALSKLVCTKVLSEFEPRLFSHNHAPFLDIAERFIKRKPENLEKGQDFIEARDRQKRHLRAFIDNEQIRTCQAAINFGQQIQRDKEKEAAAANMVDSDDDDDYP